MTGNTINACKKRLLGTAPRRDLTTFQLLFFLYYGPLFSVVFIYNSAVIPAFRAVFGAKKAHSEVWFFKFTGFVLWLLAGIWIAPVGIFALSLSLINPSLRTKRPGVDKNKLD